MPSTSFNISDFKTNFKDGARAYLFEWIPSFPTGITNPEVNVAYLVRSATLPEDMIDEIIVNWQGMDHKIAGRRTFSDWTITLNVDKKSNVRNVFNEWVNLVHKITSRGMSYGASDSYRANQILRMLDYDGNSDINTVIIYDAWVKNVGPITLDYSSIDVAQFDITFSYDFHEFFLGTVDPGSTAE